MLETWMRLGRVADGPLFRRVTKKNTGVTSERLTDKHVARLVQKTALAADIRGDLSEGERKLAFSEHSLRAGLASSAKIEEAHVQRHLGHASAEMTRRYHRKRDRFEVNLTRAAGLRAIAKSSDAFASTASHPQLSLSGPAQMFFRYLTQLDIACLTGTSSKDHMQQDLSIFEFRLSPAECESLGALLLRSP